MAAPWTAADDERARTWQLTIALTLLGPDAAWRDEGPERRFTGNGGLLVNRSSGAWYSHSAGRGGWSTIGLIRHLRPDLSRDDAIAWAAAFLTAHPGTGPCNGEADDADGKAAEAASRLRAERIQRDMAPVERTPAEQYLRSRGLEPPWPNCLGYLANARTGEGALVGVLTAHDRVVGFCCCYLDPDGRKSLVQPVRRRFMLDKAPDAVFVIPPRRDPSGTAYRAGCLIAEGLEDALSVSAASATDTLTRSISTWPTLGLPGVGVLSKLEVKGRDVLVVADGDPPGAPARKALARGVDHLLLGGTTVLLANAPEGQDANSILQSGGVEALHALIAGAKPAELSLNGDAERLSQLKPTEYEQARKATAKRHGVRVSVLDDEVKGFRPKPETPPDPSSITIEADEPWVETVALAAVLDNILAELKRYVVATETELAAAAVWCAHAHLVHHAVVRLPVSPRLAIQAPTEDSGKTTLLEIACALSARGLMASSFSAASVFRVVDAVKPSLFMDETDRIIREKDNPLMAILNGSHRRTEAIVLRVETDVQGRRKVQKFSSWAAIATAGIGVLPRTLQSRSVVIMLRKALVGEQPEHLRDGTSPALVALRRQLAAWAAALTQLPEPELSASLVNRAGDNWRVLVGIADLAGGRWPKLIRAAAENAVSAERVPSLIERLLTAIRKAFDGATGKDTDPDNPARLTTATLLQTLLVDRDDDWHVVNRGKPVTAYFLRDKLHGLVQPPEEGKPAGSTEWRTGPKGETHHRGYLRLQFVDAWARYLVPAETYVSASPDHPSRISGISRRPAGKAADQPGFGVPDGGNRSGIRSGIPDGDGRSPSDRQAGIPDGLAGIPDAASSSGTPETSEIRQKSDGLPDIPDIPDTQYEGSAIKAGRPNGAEQQPTTEGSSAKVSREAHIRRFAAANPGRSAAWLAKEIGQPEAVVRRVLGEDAP